MQYQLQDIRPKLVAFCQKIDAVIGTLQNLSAGLHFVRVFEKILSRKACSGLTCSLQNPCIVCELTDEKIFSSHNRDRLSEMESFIDAIKSKLLGIDCSRHKCCSFVVRNFYAT